MIDRHMHLEYGPLEMDYVYEFINKAIEAGIDEIGILDHTHRFREFMPLYDNLRFIDKQDQWLKGERKFCNGLDEYIGLISKVKSQKLPIMVKFGLEVCYVPECEDFLKGLLDNYCFDFLVGAIHSIDGRLYDMPFSDEILWKVFDPDRIYKRYYELCLQAANSGLFTQLAHPDTIKMFNIYPSYDLASTYRKLAQALRDNDVEAECNTGCHYRYHHNDIGLSSELLKILKEYGVKIVTASDAHRPADVGRCIREAELLINDID